MYPAGELAVLRQLLFFLLLSYIFFIHYFYFCYNILITADDN